jgi:hypothetical protein
MHCVSTTVANPAAANPAAAIPRNRVDCSAGYYRQGEPLDYNRSCHLDAPLRMSPENKANAEKNIRKIKKTGLTHIAAPTYPNIKIQLKKTG